MIERLFRTALLGGLFILVCLMVLACENPTGSDGSNSTGTPNTTPGDDDDDDDAPGPLFQIGDTGEAGGIIFYVDVAGIYPWTYMEVWTADEPSTYRWKNENTSSPGSSIALGSGASNTYSAMAGTAHPAAEIARNASHGGYNDWFLPSKDELWEIWWNLVSDQSSSNSGRGVPRDDALGDLAGSYWSSSQNTFSTAWDISFSNGGQNPFSKSATYIRVRVVRRY